MGLFSVKSDPEVFQSHGLYVHAGFRRGVHHQGDVDVLETAVFLHDDLSSQAFLGGGSVYDDFVRPVAGQLPDAEGGSDDGRPLHLMATAVSHGEGVIFCQQAEGRAALSLFINCTEGGFHSAHPVLHLKAVFLQIVLQKPAGLKFLTADFRQVINPVRKRFQF